MHPIRHSTFFNYESTAGWGEGRCSSKKIYTSFNTWKMVGCSVITLQLLVLEFLVHIHFPLI